MHGYIALGSNLGDRLAMLQAGLEGVSRGGIALRAVSSAWETEPVGTREPLWFLNAAARIETALDPEAVLAILLAVERDHGRVRGERNAPRSLDLDLLALGGLVRSGPGLELPHPRLWERAFVLAPLAEIEADLIEPVTLRTPAQALAALVAPTFARPVARLALPNDGPVYSRLS
ncbi:MAG TPA: 2-amino-4-hydroxy-6-hydroxymethyldihydropteridine diphosphokinase [Candidatus Polarisedimenticolaceae bacterium]